MNDPRTKFFNFSEIVTEEIIKRAFAIADRLDYSKRNDPSFIAALIISMSGIYVEELRSQRGSSIG